MDACVFCNNQLDDGGPVTTLQQKGCEGIKTACQHAGRSIEVTPGQKVHTNCRKEFLRDSKREKRKADSSPSEQRRKSLRSSEDTFVSKEHCLYCGTGDQYDGKRKEFVLKPVRTLRIRETILNVCASRGDSWAEKVRVRIQTVLSDLHAGDVVYHETCDSNFRTGKQIPSRFLVSDSESKKFKAGRPKDVLREEAFMQVIRNLQDSDEEQTTVYDLIDEMTKILSDGELQAYGLTHMKEKLYEHFGDKIIITEINGKKNVVTFRQKAASILSDFFHQSKSSNDETEKVRLIKAAANLIKTDIKCIEQSKDIYPTTLEMSSVDESLAFLPQSLLTFLGHLFVGKGKELRVASIGQAVMQATRPRVLNAPLQLGLGVQMHSHFASRFLNDTLYKHGFSVSYSEVSNYNKCAAVQKSVDISGFTSGHFMQYAADNVDHNIRTLDGSGTFHGMGIVADVTPKLNVTSVIKRVSVSADDIAKVGQIKLKYYSASKDDMKRLTYQRLELPRYGEHSPHIDLLWELAFAVRPQRPNWSGFMQMISKGDHPGPASVILLPMIDLNPSDLTCINSTLHFVCEHSKRYGVVPVITFDQPLWFKATTIIENEPDNSRLRSIVLRLGGFHTLMSFLGSVGHLMEGSGLREILEKVYASNTVTHIMSGKAVSRAIRAHFLLDSALSKLLLYEYCGIKPALQGSSVNHDTEDSAVEYDDEEEDDDDVDDEDDDGDDDNNNSIELSSKCLEFPSSVMKELAKMYDSLVDGEISEEDVHASSTLSDIKKMLVEKLSHHEERTSQLWLMYLKMIAIIRKFIMSERTSNWELHLDAMHEMLRFLAAAGHSLYTKSVHIYLQKMCNLRNTSPTVYDYFCKGLHAVRRSDRYWAGLSPDLVIEQVLMRSLKTAGGLTRGRGMTETQRTVWTLASPVCAEVNQAMQKLTSVAYRTSEQHKDLSLARKKRDADDVQKLVTFIEDKSPFRSDQDMINIVNGTVATDNVNVEKSEQIGGKILEEMVGKQVLKYTFRKQAHAVTMDSKSKITIDGEDVSIDPLLLFQRLVMVSTQKESLRQAFCHELCSYPPALFESRNVLLPANKPVLANAIWAVVGDVSDDQKKNIKTGQLKYVLDGGALLHKIPWDIGKSYRTICQSYISYVEKYGNPVIVFDGYQSGPTPKDCTQTRRKGTKQSVSVQFNEDMPLQIKKDDFLSNKENKQRFIHLLGHHLEKSGFDVLHAKGDADVLIVKTALEVARNSETVLVGSDTDLIVLLIHYTTGCHNRVYFMPPAKSDSPDRYLDIKKAQSVLGDKVCSNILFLHAVLGCDTTSRLFGHGKALALTLVKTSKPFAMAAEMFSQLGASKDDIIQAGEKAVLTIYKAKSEKNLDELRHKRYIELLATRKQVVHPKSLPPTCGATKYHSMRVYLQVQTWKGMELDIEQWGWTVKKCVLVPLETDLEYAPKELQKVVRCNCKSGCQTKQCGCRQLHLPCNPACGECRGICNNMSDEHNSCPC